MNFPNTVSAHIGPVTGSQQDKKNLIILTQGTDSKIVLWDSDSGKRISHIRSPDAANTPSVLKSLLLGEYLIILYGDNSIIIYEYFLEKIL
jgi:hypothetical protein